MDSPTNATVQAQEADSSSALCEGPEKNDWESYNLLSLDGGGIRGYWSLLALRKLMEQIAKIEETDDDGIYHSFWPESWPENVSQVPYTQNERKQRDDAHHEVARGRAISTTRRYLPCHYFDYICGSSTGALIAIMLGRFRMTVLDCIHEYKSLGEEVFGKSRIFSSLRFVMENRPKYKAANLKKVFEDVTERRSEQTSEIPRRITFPSKRGLCKTFVTTLMTESDSKKVAKLYLIRSYDHNERTSPVQSRRSTHRGTIGPSRANTRTDTGMSSGVRIGGRGTRGQSRIVNYEKAQQLEIWEVARAATAAPLYFEPLKIRTRSKEFLHFTDGGFSLNNNPTREGTREIEEAYSSDSIGVVVSIGTARRDERLPRRGLSWIIPMMKSMAQTATDPETIHANMEEKATSAADSFPYYRLNDPDGGLSIPLDEWQPRRSMFGKQAGSITINTMEAAFNKWAANNENFNTLTSCAAELVRRRRSRTHDTAKWERYATGAQFTCRFKRCNSEDFFNRRQFEDHLKGDHSLREETTLNEEIRDCKKYWQYQYATR